MENKQKITYGIIATIIISVASLLVLNNLDFSTGWFIVAGIVFVAFLAILAIFDFKKFILFVIAVIPTIFSLNQYKINISDFLPIFDGYGIYLNPASIFYLFIIGAGIIAIISNWQEFKKIPLKNLIIIFLAFALSSIIWSDYKNTSLIEFIYLAVPFFMYFICYLYFGDKNGLTKIFFASLLSSIIPAIISIKQIVNKEYFFEPDSSLGRITGTLAHPNSLGLYLFLIIALIIIYLISQKRRISENKIIIAYGLFLSVLLVLTYSRTSWGALAMFFLFILFIKNKLAVIALPLVASLFLTVESIKYRIIETFNNTLFNSWLARINIWKVSVAEIVKKPLWGYGIGVSELIIEKAKTWRGGTSLAHNDYLLQALELGIIGLIIYLSLNLSAIFYAYKFYSNADKNKDANFKITSYGIISLMITFLLAGITESISQKIFIQIILWAILGSFFSYAQKEKIKS